MRIKWADPDETAALRKHRPLTAAEQFAAELRKHPGRWALFSDNAANSMASAINRGKPIAFQPAGDYEAKGRRTDANTGARVRVYVRYIGESPALTGSAKADRHTYNQTIRTWAHTNGFEIAERGRVPSEIITAYENAQQDLDA